MNITKYRQHYLASLFGSTYDEKLDRVFPNVRNPQRYTNWENTQTDAFSGINLNGMKIWFASDHHFDHNNIMKYANRSFANVDHMNEHMINQHNAVVANDDVVILGGDIAFCATNKANDFLNRMNGYKILIIGNHDWERKTGALRKYAVDEIYMSYYLEVGSKKMLITHVPFQSPVMMTDTSLINLHGHIHDKKIDHPRFVNFCVEHLDYKPVQLNQLVSGV